MRRFTTTVAACGALSVLFASMGWQGAHAQTPEQMEYERQQREYWRQQEQQRQEQERLRQLQMDNARRQQEESDRASQQMMPTAPGAEYPSTPPSVQSTSAGGGGGSAAQGTATAERRYALSDHGYLVAQVPRDWRDRVNQPPDRSPPTIAFVPASGNSFQVLLTPTWPATKDGAPHSREELRAAVERGAQSARSWAVESELPVIEFQGRSGPGFYFSATERAPKPGDHSFVTTGILRVDELSMPFTVTANERQALAVKQALVLLKTATRAASASRSQPSSGTAAVSPPETRADGTLRFNTVYTCNGERVVVLRCRSEADDAYCSVQYPDRKSAATGGLTPELAERRGELVRKLQPCQG